MKNFIQKRPVVAHNGYSFDFFFLEREGLKLEEKYDSMEFAFFVMPTNAPGHSIPALAEQFKLGEAPHRALGDCKLELTIINRLQKEYGKRKKSKREVLAHAAGTTGWWWSNFLSGEKAPTDRISSLIEAYEPYRKEYRGAEMLGFQTEVIDIAEVEKYFQPAVKAGEKNGEDDYSEDRPEQREMAKMVATAFNKHKHAVIEAGTGTGKSKAYLVPSLLFGLKNRIPMIISTHTKALQDQLSLKEIPHIKNLIRPDLRVAVLKGKQNYVCLAKFEIFAEETVKELSQRSLYEFGESETRYSTRLAYLLLFSWILEAEYGDWDELPYWIKERIPKYIQAEICNIDELCGNGTCDIYDAEKCFLAKARLRARDADLVIVNHALALMGIIIEDKTPEIPSEPGVDVPPSKMYSHTVFPNESKFIVFDEAQHLEDDATSAWEHVLSQSFLQLILQQLYGKRGVQQLVKSIASKKTDERLTRLAANFESGEGNIKIGVEALFKNILPHLVSESDTRETYTMLDEIPDTSPERKALFSELRSLRQRFLDIARILSEFSEETEVPRMRKTLSVRYNTLQRIVRSFDAILENDNVYVRYLQRFGSSVEIKAAPLSVGPYLKDYVYDNFASVVMTSATLTVGKRFNFFASRCGTLLVDKEKIGYRLFHSSFNYEKQVKFFVPKGINYKEDRETHLAKSTEFLKKAIVASGGGALVLCSSHDQVGELYQGLSKTLSENNIWLLRQQKGISVSSVIRDFRRDVDSVLIGTETLWQGIDVPGESLRSLFIYKIPYRMPGLPLIKARRKEIEDNERDSFAEYYEPLAALILKQGFGRLIRKSTDIGIAVLLDENFLKKPSLMNSLPEGVHPQAAEPEAICEELHKLHLLRLKES